MSLQGQIIDNMNLRYPNVDDLARIARKKGRGQDFQMRFIKSLPPTVDAAIRYQFTGVCF